MDDKELKLECLKIALSIYKPNYSANKGNTCKDFANDIISMAESFNEFLLSKQQSR